MQQLQTYIQKTLSKKTKIDWMIVHDISKFNGELHGIDFSFVDGKERIEEPFMKNQGYLTIKKSTETHKFLKLGSDLYEKNKTNSIALSNLFILFSRVSYSIDYKEIILSHFIKKMGKALSRQIFDLLISSLNTEYYKYNFDRVKKPLNTNDWLDLFRSTQYLHCVSDPLIGCLKLVKGKNNQKVNFVFLEKMKPHLRSVIVGQYGYSIHVNRLHQKKLLMKSDEFVFLSACLIEQSRPDSNIPNWLTEEFIERSISDHWDIIGKNIFNHVFGISFRQRNDQIIDRLEELMHVILLKYIYVNNSESSNWVNKLDFPDDFISFSYWLHSKKIELNKIPTNIKSLIVNQFISELDRIANSVPNYLAIEKNYDPFKLYQLNEMKYQLSLPYLLYFNLYSSETETKKLKDIFNQYKLLFYGGYSVVQMAINFAELIILIALSGNSLKGLEEDEYKTLNNFLDIISETILIPFIHLIERNDEIWNPECEDKIFQFNAGSILIGQAYKNIGNHEIKEQYNNFFSRIKEVAVSGFFSENPD